MRQIVFPPYDTYTSDGTEIGSVVERLIYLRSLVKQTFPAQLPEFDLYLAKWRWQVLAPAHALQLVTEALLDGQGYIEHTCDVLDRQVQIKASILGMQAPKLSVPRRIHWRGPDIPYLRIEYTDGQHAWWYETRQKAWVTQTSAQTDMAIVTYDAMHHELADWSTFLKSLLPTKIPAQTQPGTLRRKAAIALFNWYWYTRNFSGMADHTDHQQITSLMQQVAEAADLDWMRLSLQGGEHAVYGNLTDISHYPQNNGFVVTENVNEFCMQTATGHSLRWQYNGEEPTDPGTWTLDGHQIRNDDARFSTWLDTVSGTPWT